MKLTKLQKRLEHLASALTVTAASLALARRRYAKQHGRAIKAHEKRKRAQAKADKLRARGRPGRAARKDARASRLGAREQKAHNAARVRLGQVKRLNQKAKGLEVTAAELRAKIKKLSGPNVKGNKVRGGTEGERLRKALLTAAAKCAGGSRRNFYAQAGAYSCNYALTGEPYGYRSDCSQFGAAIYKACKLGDPNNTGFTSGYTGTLESHGRGVSREYARKHPGCAVLFGSHGATHHVEWSLGDGTEHTVGHGSAPVDLGSFDLLSGPVQFRTY